MDRVSSRCRPFNLIDGMILIAATGVGLALVRAIPKDLDKIWRETFLAWSFRTFPVGGMLTLALLVARLRRPRPPFRRLMRQPGFNACCAVALFAVSLLLPLLVGSLKTLAAGKEIDVVVLIFFAGAFPFMSGFVVLVAWGLQAISRRWNREPGWLDRAGLALGFYWLVIAMTLTYLVFS